MRAFNPSLSILALAGSADAGKHAAFADLTRGATVWLTSGTKNVIEDTREALATLTGARAKLVRAMVDSVHAACNVEFSTHKRRPVDAATPVADAIIARAVAAFDAAEQAAADARKAKAAATKAAADKAAAALKRAAKSVEPLKAALTIADAIEALRVACSAGDDQALAGVQALAETFYSVTETV